MILTILLILLTCIVIFGLLPSNSLLLVAALFSIGAGPLVYRGGGKDIDSFISHLIAENQNIEEGDSSSLFPSGRDPNDDIIRLKEIENFLLENEEIYKKRLNLPIAGNISYMLNLDEINEVLKNKVHTLMNMGKIVHQTNFHITEWYDRPSTNLTRIWGADYIKNLIEESNNTTFDVPEYIIVLENDAKALECSITCMNDKTPMITDLLNGKIYFKKIEGECVANNLRSNMFLNNIGYVDMNGDNCNIIQDSNGINWIVDTEFSAFDFTKLLKSSKQRDIVEFLWLKFRYLYANDTFKVELSIPV